MLGSQSGSGRPERYTLMRCVARKKWKRVSREQMVLVQSANITSPGLRKSYLSKSFW